MRELNEINCSKDLAQDLAFTEELKKKKYIVLSLQLLCIYYVYSIKIIM